MSLTETNNLYSTNCNTTWKFWWIQCRNTAHQQHTDCSRL